MNDRDQRRHERLSRVQAFGRENAADFAPDSKAKTHFANLDVHLAALERTHANQLPTRASKATLLDALDLDFKNLARTARSISLTETGFAIPYRIPDDPSEETTTAHADSLLAILEDQPTDDDETKKSKAKLRAIFTSYELPANFVQHLRADRDAIRAANEPRHHQNEENLETAETINEILTLAATDVQELDTIMHNKYARDAAKLAYWSRASHVERTPEWERDTNIE